MRTRKVCLLQRRSLATNRIRLKWTSATPIAISPTNACGLPAVDLYISNRRVAVIILVDRISDMEQLRDRAKVIASASNGYIAKCHVELRNPPKSCR